MPRTIAAWTPRSAFALFAWTLFACMGATAPALAIPLTTPGDAIFGIYNTAIGGDSTASSVGNGEGQSPAGEEDFRAIDNDTATKYLNFGAVGGEGASTTTKGVNTGFVVTILQQSVLTSVQLVTANDAPARDPISISIEGANGGDLTLGASWTLIGSVNLGIDTDPGRFTAGPVVPLTDGNGYTSFRVLVQSQRGNANSTQYAEMRLEGTPVPEPGASALVGLGLALIAWRRSNRSV